MRWFRPVKVRSNRIELEAQGLQGRIALIGARQRSFNLVQLAAGLIEPLIRRFRQLCQCLTQPASQHTDEQGKRAR